MYTWKIKCFQMLCNATGFRTELNLKIELFHASKRVLLAQPPTQFLLYNSLNNQCYSKLSH